MPGSLLKSLFWISFGSRNMDSQPLKRKFIDQTEGRQIQKSWWTIHQIDRKSLIFWARWMMELWFSRVTVQNAIFETRAPCKDFRIWRGHPPHLSWVVIEGLDGFPRLKPHIMGDSRLTLPDFLLFLSFHLAETLTYNRIPLLSSLNMQQSSNWIYQTQQEKGPILGTVWTVPEVPKTTTTSPERRANPSSAPPSPKRIKTELKVK
jgi:hypothetical protein